MAEARRLKSGRWRLYKTPGLYPVHDPLTGLSPTFATLSDARRWWSKQPSGDAAVEESVKCAKCGAYFARTANRTLVGGLYYHLSHTPEPSRRPSRRRPEGRLRA